MKKILLLLLIVQQVVAQMAFATEPWDQYDFDNYWPDSTIIVDPSGKTGVTTIEEAFSRAVAGVVIELAPGTYTETGLTAPAFDFTLKGRGGSKADHHWVGATTLMTLAADGCEIYNMHLECTL